MDRDQLISLLAGAAHAAELCRSDLRLGAAFARLPGLVDTRELEVTYRRRAQHLLERGVDSFDAFAAADALAATPLEQLALAKVESGPSGTFFQLFLDPSLEQVVACLACRPADPDRSSATRAAVDA